MKKMALVAMAFLTLIVAISSNSQRKFNDFGMNKPHLLFHLGERYSVAVNYGMSYWLNNAQAQNKQYFTKSRLRYENTNDGLYVNMISHDGDTHIHQKIEDKTFNIETNVKYQLFDDGWESKIAFQKVWSKDNKYINHSVYWATYMTVENNDPKLIDYK